MEVFGLEFRMTRYNKIFADNANWYQDYMLWLLWRLMKNHGADQIQWILFYTHVMVIVDNEDMLSWTGNLDADV